MARTATKDDALTIDGVARETGMTVRNIRAHQSRGLLPAPEVRGRTGYYGPEHVARLRLIQDMQAQGFNLKSIQRLIDMPEADSAEAARFQRALLGAFGPEEPEVITAAELQERFGDAPDRKTAQRAEKLGVLRQLSEDTFEVPSPTMLGAAEELVRLGVPLDHAVVVGEKIAKHTQSIAKEFVRLFVQDVLEPLDERPEMAEREWARANEALERLRPLATEAVLAGFQQSMAAAVERQLEKGLKG